MRIAACTAFAVAAFAPQGVQARPFTYRANAGTWKTFSPENGLSTYYGILRGPDDAIWVADNHDALLLRFDAAGNARAFSVAPFFPNQMTVGADGAFYINSSSMGAIARVTVAGSMQVFSIPSGDIALGGMALGPDGKVWFTEQSHVGSITTSGVVAEYALTNLGVAGGGVAAGHDGNVWFAGVISGGPAMVSKINPSTGSITTYPVDFPRPCYPEALAAGPHVDMWFNCASSLPNRGGIGRIAPNGAYRVFRSAIGPTFAPQAVALGPDKAMWYVGDVSGTAVLERFDITAFTFTSYTAPAGTNPQWGLTFDTRGNVWGSSLGAQVDEFIR
jgi:virginiamycin B lyase